MNEHPYDLRVVPLNQIDRPDVAMRESMDDEKMAELVQSIKRVGILQPVGLRPVGDRYRIVFGDRRCIAAQLAGETVVPAKICHNSDTAEEELKLTENYVREEVNPAEEAVYLDRILEGKFGGDIVALCNAIGRKESWVQGRLDLIDGDARVFQALRERKITMAVARELQRIPGDDRRALRLTDAIKFGANGTTVRGWRLDDEREERLNEARARGDLEPSGDPPPASIHTVDECILCRTSQDPLDMEYVKVHKSCRAVHRRDQEAAMRAEV